jgi:hypothetical protein
VDNFPLVVFQTIDGCKVFFPKLFAQVDIQIVREYRH